MRRREQFVDQRRPRAIAPRRQSRDSLGHLFRRRRQSKEIEIESPNERPRVSLPDRRQTFLTPLCSDEPVDRMFGTSLGRLGVRQRLVRPVPRLKRRVAGRDRLLASSHRQRDPVLRREMSLDADKFFGRQLPIKESNLSDIADKPAEPASRVPHKEAEIAAASEVRHFVMASQTCLDAVDPNA